MSAIKSYCHNVLIYYASLNKQLLWFKPILKAKLYPSTVRASLIPRTINTNMFFKLFLKDLKTIPIFELRLFTSTNVPTFLKKLILNQNIRYF